MSKFGQLACSFFSINLIYLHISRLCLNKSYRFIIAKLLKLSCFHFVEVSVTIQFKRKFGICLPAVKCFTLCHRCLYFCSSLSLMNKSCDSKQVHEIAVIYDMLIFILIWLMDNDLF